MKTSKYSTKFTYDKAMKYIYWLVYDLNGKVETHCLWVNSLLTLGQEKLFPHGICCIFFGLRIQNPNPKS